MKRPVYFVMLLMMLLGLCGCTDTADFKFVKKGEYKVITEDGDISFIAVLDGNYEKYTFTSPKTVYGLTATTYDGVNYTLNFDGIEKECFSEAIKVATDFSAAAELLELNGKVNKNRLCACVDGQKAEAVIGKSSVTEIDFTDGKDTRNYKIITEATG